MTANYFCVRSVILGGFILLGLSGITVCISSSIFLYQLHQNESDDNNNADGPPAILLSLGLVTTGLAIYFWFVMDYKYNRPQLIMFLLTLLSVTAIKVCAGIWALIIYEQLNTKLSHSLEETLFLLPKVELNFTEIQVNCCSEGTKFAQSCCSFQGLDNATRVFCEDAHGLECRHWSINRHSSITIHVFLTALLSIVFQIILATSLVYHGKILKKHKKRRRQSALEKPNR